LRWIVCNLGFIVGSRRGEEKKNSRRGRGERVVERIIIGLRVGVTIGIRGV